MDVRLGHAIEQRDGVGAQHFGGAPLGLLPSGKCVVDQALAGACQAKGLGATVVGRHDFEPACGAHPLDVAAESRRVELEDFADLGRPGEAELGRDDQDVELAGLEAERRSASSYRFVTTRLSRRSRTAMHVWAMRSTFAAVLDMVLWLVSSLIDCIYK